MRKNVWFWLIVIAAIAVSITMIIRQDKPIPEENEVLKANLACFHLYISAPIVAADLSEKIVPGKDCFAEAGINPTIIKRSKGPEIVDALVGGSADFGTLAITPQVFQLLQGSEFVIFATIQTTDHDIKVVGYRSAGVNDGASLKGKRIGFVGGTFGEIFLNRYLKKHGMSRNDISLTSGGPAQLRDLFLSKALDAIIIWEPIIQDILADPSINKADIMVDVDPSIYTGRINLVARPEVLKAKAEEARRLVQSMIAAEGLIQDHPDKVRLNLEAWLDRKPDTLIDVFDKETFIVKLDVPGLIRDLQMEAKWAQEAIFHGKAKMPKDFSKYVDASILKAVAQDRIKE